MASDATTPTKIKKLTPGEIQILWADGHETRHLAPLLRGLRRGRTRARRSFVVTPTTWKERR